jgi:hypothetical protein
MKQEPMERFYRKDEIVQEYGLNIEGEWKGLGREKCRCPVTRSKQSINEEYYNKVGRTFEPELRMCEQGRRCKGCEYELTT